MTLRGLADISVSENHYCIRSFSRLKTCNNIFEIEHFSRSKTCVSLTTLLYALLQMTSNLLRIQNTYTVRKVKKKEKNKSNDKML